MTKSNLKAIYLRVEPEFHDFIMENKPMSLPLTRYCMLQIEKSIIADKKAKENE